MERRAANDLAHLPAPALQLTQLYNGYQQMQEAAIQRSAEGAGQVQPLLGRFGTLHKIMGKPALID